MMLTAATCRWFLWFRYVLRSIIALTDETIRAIKQTPYRLLLCKECQWYNKHGVPSDL